MEIRGREVFKIKKIGEHRPFNVVEGHSFFGQFYNTYRYNGIAFTVNEEDDFVAWKDAGKLFSVEFKEYVRQVKVTDPDTQEEELVDTPSLEMISCTNSSQEIGMARTELLLSSLTLENLVAGRIKDPTELIELGD